jgi:hypothetical protein
MKFSIAGTASRVVIFSSWINSQVRTGSNARITTQVTPA